MKRLALLIFLAGCTSGVDVTSPVNSVATDTTRACWDRWSPLYEDIVIRTSLPDLPS